MIIESNKKFEPHPQTDGPIRAVVVDVTDPVEKQTAYGPKKKFAIIFETEMKRPDGSHWTFWSHGYTPVLGDRSNLQRDVLKILGGTKLPDKFDTEDLIGKPVKLIIEHKNDDGEIYANMTWLAQDKLPDAMKPSGTYIRQKDKEKKPDNGRDYAKADGAPEQKETWQQTKVHVGRFTGQQVENLPLDALKGLINVWMVEKNAAVTEGKEKYTADDRRLMAALEEAKKMLPAEPAPAPAPAY